jgi:hypothetical protein
MIIRTYGCANCGNFIEVELRADQWDQEPPDCQRCLDPVGAFQMVQEFKPPAIGGTAEARAVKIAEDIMAKDYNVADFKPDNRVGGTPKVRYNDTKDYPASTWNMPSPALAQAAALGRENRLKHGNGLDALQWGLKSGTQPDLIALSKARSARIW